MIIGWVLLVGLATVISRHFKKGLGNKGMLGSKVWFQVI